ncbi:MAG: methionine--tRNA ligase, partial [Lentisphaerae bacterium]|nr:methionine--tRNA ligase [Lentisphaerota bacterium]
MKAASFYITTPIYYVNDAPHIGHAYTTILADVLARYQRLAGVPTFLLTGTDEHGQKVQRAAERAGIAPLEQANRTVVHFQELWQKLHITSDDFIRTTEPRHTRIVQQILQTLYDKGEIYQAQYDGWYCVPCERFYTERDLTDGQCQECGRELERITETNYFFRMSAYQDWLIEYIQQHPEFIQPDFRRNETLGFLQKPLNDLCISRPKTRLTWGIDLPFDPQFVTYVWFDALVNYISAVGYLADEDRFRRWWPASYHLIGKDILTTHTVYWPTMLKAMGLPLPKTIFAHGWWLLGASKMSKSTGNVVNPMDLAERYGSDAFRYFLMAEMTLGQDCRFSEEAFIRRYNADLANDIGNLLSRIMKLVHSHCGGKIPAPGEDSAAEPALRQAVLASIKSMRESIAQMRLDQGLAAVIGAVRATNRYLEQRQPWTLAKQPEQRPLHTVLYHAAETLRIIGGLLSPIMPDQMSRLRQALGLSGPAPTLSELERWGGLPPQTSLGAAIILFPRLGSTPPAAPAPAPATPPAATPAAEQISYDEFAKIHLRTARIVSAAKIPGADKLFQLQLELKGEQRPIVAGIAKNYAPEDLIGKIVVGVTNLKPAKIRGVTSNGMLLAASQGSE